jgi:aspartyl-tRNA(Asn)/glutamyl-tRNA(Gln) amidotransferase subunit C
MVVTKQEIEKIAKLSKLIFSDEELESFTAQIKEILEHIEKINELELDDISQAFHFSGNRNHLREDSMKPWLTQKEALKNAPEKHEGFFCVPKVIKRR